MWKNSLVMRQFVALCITCIVSVVYSQNNGNGFGDSSVQMVFNHDRIVVNPGQDLNLDCGVEGKYRYCIWEREESKDTPKRTIQVLDVREGFTGISNPDNIDNGNKCGIIVNSVSTEDNGLWTCVVLAKGNTLRESKNVLVTVKPTEPKLNVYENPLVIEENVERPMTCFVAAARPAVQIRWFIDAEDVTSRSEADAYPIDDLGTYSSNSTLYYTFTHENDKSIVRCSIEHPTLEQPENADVQLDIKFKPYPLSALEFYGIPMGNEYEIKYNFTANPEPTMIWYIGAEEVAVPSNSGRYTAVIEQINNGGNTYMAILKIRDFTAEDIGTVYRLNAINDFGEKNFDISLSSGPAPPDGDNGMTEYYSPSENKDSQESIETGTVVAIVVVILIIVLILMVIAFMRYRQMFCFDKKDKIKNHMKDTEDLKEEHDTESSSAPPREPNQSKKATNLLKNIRSKFPSMPTRKGQKEPRLDKLEEGENKEQVEDQEEEKGKTNPEVVYAELDLANGENKKDSPPSKIESTEYAEIVGTVQDNKRQEQRE